MSRLRTGYALHPASPLHDPGWGHPEHQGRLPAVAEAIGRSLPDLLDRVTPLLGRFATREELESVHPTTYLDHLEACSTRAAREGGVVLAGEEAPFSAATWEAILGSAGSALQAAEEIVAGRIRNAFVATRPPGHHASAERAMGFCALNHVAVVARVLQRSGRAARVAIVDWDVHHGNGTQDIFYEDPSVFFLSLHQFPFYPGSGAASERGAGAGEGTTLNIPIPVGTGGVAYREAFVKALQKVEKAFRPDFVLISAGYDTLAGDPLGGLLLEPEDYHFLARQVMEWADRACGGKVLALLEGGYAPRRTGEAAAATLRALAGV